jgi:hypothetical protein
MLGERIGKLGNIWGTWWEHDENTLGTRKTNKNKLPPPHLLKIKIKIGPIMTNNHTISYMRIF